MTSRLAPIAAVALPPLVLAGVGITHPAVLSADTAQWWTTMHIGLLVLFPLIGVAVWVSLRHDKTWFGWVGRVAAVAFAVLYDGLDALAGIATGTIVLAGADPKGEAVTALFVASKPLGWAGLFALAIAILVVVASGYHHGSSLALLLIAAVALGAGMYLFATGHIYWPRGVLAMLGLALGFTVVELARRKMSEPT
jgi:hypothetical protein